MADPLDTLSNALSVARLRVNVLAANMANAETTKTADGGPYKRKDVVQVGIPVRETFDGMLQEAQLAKPQVRAVIEDSSEPRKVYQPGHPDADKEGYVAYPNINVVQTMTDLMSATRLYQANATAIENLRQMERDGRNIASS